MTFDLLLSSAVAIGLLAYLAYALVNPDKF
jgi:K+-transporting ATPase KdpF subunit